MDDTPQAAIKEEILSAKADKKDTGCKEGCQVIQDERA
jgi:hypothetical protein